MSFKYHVFISFVYLIIDFNVFALFGVVSVPDTDGEREVCLSVCLSFVCETAAALSVNTQRTCCNLGQINILYSE